MQFYFIRHAQSENNALWARTGSWHGRDPDPGLTDVGLEQAAHLARFLANGSAAPGANGPAGDGFGLTHLYTSLMQRAVATGAIVAEGTGVPLVAWEEIHERGGIFHREEGMDEPVGLAGPDRAFFAERFPTLALPATWDTGGWWDRPFERWADVPGRAQRFLHDLLERHDGREDRVAIISHGGFYAVLLSVLLDASSQAEHLDDERPFWFDLNNAAITRIDFKDDVIRLVYLNRVDYLPAGLVT